jgi:hypothetical protein
MNHHPSDSTLGAIWERYCALQDDCIEYECWGQDHGGEQAKLDGMIAQMNGLGAIVNMVAPATPNFPWRPK